MRRISDIDRASLERDSYNFNVHLLLGGQVRGKDQGLYLVYPQGNPLAATEDSLYLQLGNANTAGRFLIVGIQESTSLEVAAKYALLSMDATMRSNVTVGPPFDLLLYKRDSLQVTRVPAGGGRDPELNSIHAESGSSRCGVPSSKLPDIEFEVAEKKSRNERSAISLRGSVRGGAYFRQSRGTAV